MWFGCSLAPSTPHPVSRQEKNNSVSVRYVCQMSSAVVRGASSTSRGYRTRTPVDDFVGRILCVAFLLSLSGNDSASVSAASGRWSLVLNYILDSSDVISLASAPLSCSPRRRICVQGFQRAYPAGSDFDPVAMAVVAAVSLALLPPRHRWR